MRSIDTFPHGTTAAVWLRGGAACLHAGYPIITEVFTADPASLVVDDTVYLYCGQNEAKSERDSYRMNRWLCFSIKGMTT